MEAVADAIHQKKIALICGHVQVCVLPISKQAGISSEEVTLVNARKALCALANPRKAQAQRVFFKHCQDTFLGVTTPQIRQLVRQFTALPLSAVAELTKSRIHEEHSLSHAILVRKFQSGDAREKERIFRFYMRHRKYIRDWDGVDDSAPYIVGRTC